MLTFGLPRKGRTERVDVRRGRSAATVVGDVNTIGPLSIQNASTNRPTGSLQLRKASRVNLTKSCIMLVAWTAQTPASMAPPLCARACVFAFWESLRPRTGPGQFVQDLSSLSIPTNGRGEPKNKKAQEVVTKSKLLDRLLALHDSVIGWRRLHRPGRWCGGQGRVGICRDPADGFLWHLPPYSIQPPGRK